VAKGVKSDNGGVKRRMSLIEKQEKEKEGLRKRPIDLRC
jgi:hypothetical protein